MGLLCNWFVDLGRDVKQTLGPTWTITLMVVCLFITLWLFQSVVRASINKTKIVFKWGQIVFMIIFLLLSIWLITLL